MISHQQKITRAYDAGFTIEKKGPDSSGDEWTEVPKEGYLFDFKTWQYRIKKETRHWRAPQGGEFYYINIFGHICSDYDDRSEFATSLWESLNYFRIPEDANLAASTFHMALDAWKN